MTRRKGFMRIIGLMSGTSHDGVDAALVEIKNLRLTRTSSDEPSMSQGLTKGDENPICHPEPCAELRFSIVSGSHWEEILKQVQNDRGKGSSDEISITLIRHLHIPYRKSLRDEIRRAFDGRTDLICRLNFRLGEIFAGAVLSLLKATGLRSEEIDAVASHGQTIYHIPPSGKKQGSTLQIGEASVIAERTGILTISDFRTADIAAGGQGAPLVPLADYLLLYSWDTMYRAVLNIGGIANVTIVSEKMDDTVAFDTGPGNSLIDEAMLLYSAGKRSFDNNGSFARSGRPVKKLLDELLSHPYFKKKPPKSTGRETFGTGMVRDIFKRYRRYSPQDILATLTHLTARTIYDAVIKFMPDEVILTGGGVKNRFLVELIHNKFKESGVSVNDISVYGIPTQAKEAVSFAILGYQTLIHRPGNIPSVTGAGRGVILGKISLPL